MKYLTRCTQIALLFSLIFVVLTACDQKAKEETPPEDFIWTTDSEDAMNSLLTGLAYQDVGDNTSSRAHMTAALEADPDFAIAYVFRSFSSGSASEFKADTDMAVSLMENTSEEERILIKINQTYLNNDNAGRLEMFKQLTDSLPSSARVWYFLAFEQDGRNETEAARKNYEKAQQLNPSWVGAYVGAGGSYLFSEPKDFGLAESNFTKAVELGPEFAFNHINLGDAYRAQNDLEKASASYTKAIKLEPQNFVAYTKRGHANSFLGNYDNARKDFQASREFNEYGNQAFTFEAFTYLYEGDVDKSLAWLEEQAIGLDSSDLTPQRIASGKLSCANSCAWIALHHGKIDHLDRLKEMRNMMNLEINKDMETPEATRNAKANNAYWDGLTAVAKGDFVTAMGKADENKSLMEESTNPNKLFSYNFLMGYINFHLGDFESAEQNFREGNRNWVYNNYFLGKTLKAAGKEEEGDALLQKVAINNFNGVHFALIRNELLGS